MSVRKKLEKINRSVVLEDSFVTGIILSNNELILAGEYAVRPKDTYILPPSYQFGQILITGVRRLNFGITNFIAAGAEGELDYGDINIIPSKTGLIVELCPGNIEVIGDELELRLNLDSGMTLSEERS